MSPKEGSLSDLGLFLTSPSPLLRPWRQGFWWGNNIALLSRPQANGGCSQVLEVEMNVDGMQARSAAGKDPFTHTMCYRAAGAPSSSCPTLDALREAYPHSIDQLIRDIEENPTMPSGSFTLFVISGRTSRVPVFTDDTFNSILRNLKQMYPYYLDRAPKPDCVPDHLVPMEDLDIRLVLMDDKGKTLLRDGKDGKKEAKEVDEVSLREHGWPRNFERDTDMFQGYHAAGFPNLPWVDGWTRLLQYAARRPVDPQRPNDPAPYHTLRFRLEETDKQGKIGHVYGLLFYLPASSEFEGRESRDFLDDYFPDDTTFLCFWHGRLMPGERLKTLPFLELTLPGNAWDPAQQESHDTRMQLLTQARRRVVGLLFFHRDCPNNVVKSQFDGQVHKILQQDARRGEAKRDWDQGKRAFEVSAQDRPNGRWSGLGRYKFSEWLLDCTKRFDRSVVCSGRVEARQGMVYYKSATWGTTTFSVKQWVQVKLVKGVDLLDTVDRGKQKAGVRRVVMGQIESISIKMDDKEDDKADPYKGHTALVKIVNTPLEMYGNTWAFPIHRLQKLDTPRPALPKVTHHLLLGST